MTISKDLSPEEKNQLLYLLLSIESYYEQQNAVIPRHILIYLVVNSKGLKTLKRMRFKSFIESNQGTLLEKPDWYDEVPFYHSYDIGEIFNYNYGFFWQEEDTQDYLLSKTPVKTDSEIVNLFKKVTDRIISATDDFDEVLPEEILFRVNSSKSIDKEGNSFPNYHIKHDNLQFSSVRKEGKRCLITTSPGSGRDAIVNNVNDLNTIQLINENIRKFLLKNFRKNILTESLERNKKRFFSKCNKNQFFYCRDIKKEGLTKPKYLCEIVLQALHKRFPECLAFQFPYFYSGPWYEGDTGERGHGLGMANELTTLIQILILFTTNYLIGEEGDYVVSSGALYLNDDAVVFINGTFDDIECFVDYDYQVCTGLGVMIQRDKSFYSDSCAIFCEMYFSRGKPFVNDKISYKNRELKIIERASNILEAKLYAGNMKGSLTDIENILKHTYLKLGYEFNKEEINWPITLGGLRPFKLLNVDHTLKYVESYVDVKLLYRAYNANKERRLKRWNKYLKEYIPPLAKIYPVILKEKDESILERLGLGSVNNLSSVFFRPSKEGKLHWAVEKLYKRRQEIFLKDSGSPTFEDFCKIYASESLSNVSLNNMFYERLIEVEIFSMKKFKDPYTVTNPIVSYLNTLGVENNKVASTKWGLFQQNCVLTAEKSVFARLRMQNTLSLIDRFEEDIETDFLVFPKNDEDIEDFMESYPKPFMTYGLVQLGNKLGIPKQEFRNPILKSRKEVFGKYLNRREFILSQPYTWQRINFMLKFEESFKGMIDFDNDFWDAVDERVRILENKGEPPPKEEVSPEENEMYNTRMVLDTDTQIIDDAPIETIEVSSGSDDQSIESIESINMFMIENGPLPDGDISVYGSQDWLLYFFNLERWEQDPYLEADPDLRKASVDTMAFQRGVMPGSDAFKEKNQVLEDNLIFSSGISWVAYVYNNVFRNIKPPEDEEFDTSTLFED
jgi:hypothetical protein